MRKALVIFIVVFALVLGGATFAFNESWSQRDRVEVTEIVRFGDASAAEGLSLDMHTNFDHHLFWDIRYTPGAPELTDTEYRVSVRRDYGVDEYDHRGIALYSMTDEYCFFDRVIEQGAEPSGIGLAMYELWLETPAGEERTKEFFLKDYLEYYPIAGEMDIPGLDMDIRPDELAWNLDTNDEEAWKLLNDYFRIPVLETQKHHISIARDGQGNFTSWGSGSGNSEDSYWFSTCSVLMPDAVYFTISNRTGLKNEIMDTSLIPGGYGIYRLPYTLEDGVYEVKFDELSTVKSLDEDFSVRFILCDEPKEKLLVLGSYPDRLSLLVLDAATMETLQTIDICSEGNYDIWQYFDGGSFICLFLSDNRTALVERQPGGEYLLRFVIEDEADGVYFNRYDVQDMAWDGERLALSGFKSIDDFNQRYAADFYYAVYDETGLLRFVDCDSSLYINGEQQWPHVRGDDSGGMDLYWS